MSILNQNILKQIAEKRILNETRFQVLTANMKMAVIWDDNPDDRGGTFL
jgi:hypothetical protein